MPQEDKNDGADVKEIAGALRPSRPLSPRSPLPSPLPPTSLLVLLVSRTVEPPDMVICAFHFTVARELFTRFSIRFNGKTIAGPTDKSK